VFRFQNLRSRVRGRVVEERTNGARSLIGKLRGGRHKKSPRPFDNTEHSGKLFQVT